MSSEQREVWVAVYRTKNSDDIRVFTTSALCDEWRDQIGRDWWDHEYPDDPMPTEDVGEKYFERQYESCFPETFTAECIGIEEKL